MKETKIEESKGMEEKNRSEPQDHKQGKKRSGARSMREWNNLIDQRIGEAMEEGAFENLPGTGKRQNLEKNPFVPEGHGLAFDILQNNDLAPTWISERKEIQTEIEKLRKLIQTEATWHHIELSDATDDEKQQWLQKTWQRCLSRWQVQIESLNDRINTLNLNQPIAHLELLKLRLDDELARAEANRQLSNE